MIICGYAMLDKLGKVHTPYSVMCEHLLFICFNNWFEWVWCVIPVVVGQTSASSTPVGFAERVKLIFIYDGVD